VCVCDNGFVCVCVCVFADNGFVCVCVCVFADNGFVCVYVVVGTCFGIHDNNVWILVTYAIEFLRHSALRAHSHVAPDRRVDSDDVIAWDACG